MMVRAAAGRPTGGGGLPVTSGLALHLDAQSLSLSDTDPVSSWTDLSGNGYDGAGTGVTYIASAINGHPAVRFDGVDDWVDVTSYANLFSNQVTAFAMLRNWTAGTPWGGSRNQSWLARTSGGDVGRRHWVNADEADFASTAPGAGPVVLANVYNYATGDFAVRADGVQIGSLTASRSSPSETSSDFHIGKWRSGDWYAGDQGEVIVYDRILDASETSDVESYMEARWSA